jgi:hypothetical protein
MQLVLCNLEDARTQHQALIQLDLCLRSVGVHALGALEQLIQLAARRRGLRDEGVELPGELLIRALVENAQIGNHLFALIF